MFVPAKISMEEVNLLPQYLLPKNIETSDTFYEQILEQSKVNGKIDGSVLSNLTFPFAKDHYDVFISYSHNDESIANRLCAYLSHKGLSCFLDSTIWHSADALLNVIDHQYSWSEDEPGYFDYEKRNFSTSHVHTMLSMAMLEAIRRSEFCLFIESDNSVTLEEGIKDHTLSPWIYAENLYIRNINPELPERYKVRGLKTFSQGGILEQRESEGNDLKVEYHINLDDFIRVYSGDFMVIPSGTQILDNIYRRNGIIRQIAQRIRNRLYD